MKIADRLKALKIAALKKQKELMELQADTAFGRELMRLQHLKELDNTDQGEAGGVACCSDEALYRKEDQARGLLQVLVRVLKETKSKKLLR